jgi:hypothetical protein
VANFTTYIYPVLDGEETEIEVVVDYDANYQPARVSGPPEDCYPEDSEMTINSVTTEFKGWESEIANEIENCQDILEEQAWEDYHSRGVDDQDPPDRDEDD